MIYLRLFAEPVPFSNPTKLFRRDAIGFQDSADLIKGGLSYDGFFDAKAFRTRKSSSFGTLEVLGMGDYPGARRSVIQPDHLANAHRLLERTYTDELTFPGSPVNAQLIRLNLDHAERVRRNAVAIGLGEHLEVPVLELAAILHDIAKLDHRDAESKGIDTWHHHYRGAAMAKRFVLSEFQDEPLAERIARMIDAHSDIPFIRRYWLQRYATSLPGPRTAEDFALRDADVIDMLWVGGMSKIVQFRQVPSSEFFKEDGGEIRKAVLSAQTSFQESASVITTDTALKMARERISIVGSFFDKAILVKSLQEFIEICDEFVAKQHPAPA
jgi:hypothetical protein